MHSKNMIEWVWRCTWRAWSSEYGDTHRGCDWARLEICTCGGHDHANLEAVMEQGWRYALQGHERTNLKAVIDRVWRCTWRLWLCKHAGCNRASLAIHLEAMIRRAWRCTWRPWSSEFGDSLEGRDRVNSDKFLEEVNGQDTGCWDSIPQLYTSQPWDCDKGTVPLNSHGELADGGRSCREAHRKLKVQSLVSS